VKIISFLFCGFLISADFTRVLVWSPSSSFKVEKVIVKKIGPAPFCCPDFINVIVIAEFAVCLFRLTRKVLTWL
jgi:hypothetical protein